MMKIVQKIPFDSIKYYPKLFNDYVEHYDSVAELYGGNPFDEQTILHQIQRCRERTYHRETLIKLLLKHNRYYRLKRAVAKNIHKLKYPDSVAVVTGQQAGLFGGPLYTIYKAITAVKYAEYIEQTYNVPAVPVFWIEVDDHDFDEVRRTSLLLPGGTVKTFTYSDGRDSEPMPIKNRIFAESITSFLDDIVKHFGGTETSNAVFKALSSIYIPERAFCEGFIAFFRAYFPRLPIVFLNPGDPEIKQLARPFFERALIDYKMIHDVFKQQTEAVQKKSYKPHVSLYDDDYHLFHIVGGNRVRLTGKLLSAGAGKGGFDYSDVSSFLNRSLPDLSPDVLLRPVLQDYLIPTLLYIGGPSEIAYFAQLKLVYKYFNIPMPLLVPRWSGTIVEKKSLRFLKKFRIEPSQVLTNEPNDVLDAIIEQTSGNRFTVQFQKTYIQLKGQLNEIRTIGASLDTTLLGMIDNSEQKMKYQLDKIQGRFHNALQKSNQVTVERVHRTINAIIPDSHLQERTFSVLNYLLRYGNAFPRFLMRTVTIDTREHHIIGY